MMTTFLFIILFCVGVHGEKGYRLKQVLILSRHNIRAPLSDDLQRTTDLEWPTWKTEVTHLTAKGALLEGYIANYIAEWLKKEGLIDDTCPTKDEIQVYANTCQRTKETAKAFVKSAFKNCNITVFSKNTDKMDPVFNPIIHNVTDEFKEIGVRAMKDKLDALNMKDAYALIDKIIDFKNSDICRTESICDLVNDNNNIIFEVNEEPNIYGPLSIVNSVADFFLMSLYEGFAQEDIAWGKLIETHDWRLLSDIVRENQIIRFGSSILAKDVAKTLIKYMANIFFNEKSAPKLTLLVGHDSNLNSVMTSLGFKPFELPNQYERTPIGGKLVFQRWSDEKGGRDLLKVNYVYQTVKQLRHGTPLSSENPPKSVTMEIEGCEINERGFCLWDDFVKILTMLD
ncbi:glucose-1-phosphatase-like [Galleria mellonella]|uniref:Glucose-1-phosphatase-like n=1 Tax=Galleria mellonella TaxID=7137 RepID=A0A6J1WSS3_GALME|nr:glucose-1-phosphatase-like [Galleria mellonella]